jgi:DNA-directed RNA polymerase subunit RPC12/RpoP
MKSTPPLTTTHPEIAAQANGWNPESVTAGSSKRMEWRCESGHVWSAVVYSRLRNGCPICAGRKVQVGLNDLVTTHPEIAAQASGWNPKKVSAGSGRNLLWSCELGHQWKATVGARTRGRGCPVCGNRKVLAGFNDLATTHPEIAAEAHGWNPKTLTFGSNKSVEWKCGRNHVWSATVNDRTGNAGGCPYCSNKRLLVGFNDLATTHPEIAALAHGWDPRELTAGSEEKREWNCDLGHSWSATVGGVVRGSGCGVCRGLQIVVGFNDLKTTHPDVASQAHGWNPKTLTAGSGKRMEWRCSLGHVWKVTVSSRTYSNNGCPYCGNKRLLTGFNDLKTKFPEIALLANGWDPSKVLAGSRQKMEWKCVYGHEWTETVQHRTRGFQHRECFTMSLEEALALQGEMHSALR